MKFFIFLVLLGTTLAAPNPFKSIFQRKYERKLSDQAKEILEDFRQLILNGNPDKGIPILDPYKLETYDFEFKTNSLSVKVKTTNGQLKGLGDFIVNNIDIPASKDKITFDGSLPMVVIDAGTYDLKGLVFNSLPIYGNGVAHFEIGNFVFTGVSGLAEGPDGVYLTDINLVFTLETFLSTTNGMLGGGDIDDLINQMLADMAPEFFNENSELMSALVSDLILNSVNEVLKGLSLQDLIDIVS